ncbi:hypothetical protein MKJ04_22490 [Pontibacter sp. E15-1]|uniref:hypothetical protein n=1 Tax=Pontibacter sp. E15-1 TaxID=2919918 RepID=UPI001F50122E|nr:hypothetical protein [Pontibacter sp. E15-1]MCJ8167629.1 hypothetical protein [Pontibacter sp. E15-1]
MYSELLDELSKAVGARLLIRFDYGDETYTVEPHLIGQDQDNQDCLCAWLDGKKSASEATDGWYTFQFTEIKNMRLLNDRFCQQRPGYDPYNKCMNRIYYRL